MKVSQNLQENNRVRVSFSIKLLTELLIKLQAQACNFIKTKTLTQVFSCEFCDFFLFYYYFFFIEHLRWLFLEKARADLLTLESHKPGDFGKKIEKTADYFFRSYKFKEHFKPLIVHVIKSTPPKKKWFIGDDVNFYRYGKLPYGNCEQQRNIVDKMNVWCSNFFFKISNIKIISESLIYI